MLKTRFLLIIISLAVLILSGCTTPKVTSIVYDTPKIIVPYEEIMSSYHLQVDEKQFSTKEIEEIFNLLKTMKIASPDDPRMNRFNFTVYLDYIHLVRQTNGNITVSMGEHNEPYSTTGSGNLLWFNHTSNRKYELLVVEHFIR